MARQVVIVHGWSDDSDSFKPLARFLKQNGFDTLPIHLGDYISLKDDVRIEDVAKRMEEVIRDAQSRTGRNKLGNTFDMIVHSTGGLVARQWITSFYRHRACPVQNLLMLAPANFGSALAHLGRSMLGRIAKGWRTGFETGEEMLYDLELGAPFQWELAQRDLFVPDGDDPADAPALYGGDKVRPFVLVGTYPYRDLVARITNENGSDGTVRVAAANLNCQGRTVNFAAGPDALEHPEVREWSKRGGDGVRFPVAVLSDRDHGSIIDPGDQGGAGEIRGQLGELILQALRANAGNYDRVAEAWDDVSMKTRELALNEAERERLFGRAAASAECYHEHFQLVVRAEDEFGTPIPDFFVRFTKRPRRRLRALSDLDAPSVYFQHEVLADVHTHRRSSDCRCFYIDRYDMMRSGGWYDQIRNADERELTFTVTAADPGDNVAYFERRPGARGVVLLHRQGAEGRWLTRHTTHFIRVIVPRAGKPGMFKLKRG